MSCTPIMVMGLNYNAQRAPTRWRVRKTGHEDTRDGMPVDSYDSTLFARCAGESNLLDTKYHVRTAIHCEKLCSQASGCHAVEYLASTDTCQLYAQCMHRIPVRGKNASSVPTQFPRVMHRWGPSVPNSPAHVKWITNLTVVVSSFDGPMSWLGR